VGKKAIETRRFTGLLPMTLPEKAHPRTVATLALPLAVLGTIILLAILAGTVAGIRRREPQPELVREGAKSAGSLHNDYLGGPGR
jgi:hypothetical protein